MVNQYKNNLAIALTAVCVTILISCNNNGKTVSNKNLQQVSWPDSIPWWKHNNLRLIQTNLPAYEAGLNVDSLVDDLIYFSANTLIINAGGIMAFYPTKLENQYINPYMQKDMLKDVISKCHDNGIKVIVRFDFSRAHQSIFEKHPDWFYLSPKGERIINQDMYTVSINAPYEQQVLFEIVEEVIDNYPIDGLFMNMPGYQTRNPYLGVYHGIDQNQFDKARFAEFSGGLDLPLVEDQTDAVFRKYQDFKKHTTDNLMERLQNLVRSKSDQIAICTYMDSYVDIIRHESQTRGLPHWPYSASDNVNNSTHSYPDHIISNASIQQISFQSRYNAVEPEETTIRFYENIANGSGLDISLMGDFQDYEDERNYPVIRQLYEHHKKFEPYFGRYTSPAEVLVVSPGYWPGGEPMLEYRGILLMLKEAHIQHDIIEEGQLNKLKANVLKYKLILVPEIVEMDSASLQVLEEALDLGIHLIGTNRSFAHHPEILEEFFGATIDQMDHEGSGFYLNPEDQAVFPSLQDQSLLFFKYNLGLYDFSKSDFNYLPIFTPGIPGPPEKIGGHEPTGYFAMGIKKHRYGNAVLLPLNLGKLYYLYGYEQHKNVLLDAISYAYPEVGELVETNAHPRVEVILQNFIKNTPLNLHQTDSDGMILHLVNITGFSGNTYFHPLSVRGLEFKIESDFRPNKVFSMVNEQSLEYSWNDGILNFALDKLDQFDGIIIEK